MSGNPSKLIAFNYFGGKFTWLDQLYDNFPEYFTHLIDLFGGSFSVSLNYPKRIIKTANEIDGEITNFFEMLRDHPEEFIKQLLLTPCSELEYDRCWNPSDNDIERARRFYVRIRQSFFGLGGQRKNKGWSMAKETLNCDSGETVSKWNNGISKLEEIVNVLRVDFQIINLHYKDAIDKTDNPKAFFYCDPPYSKRSRVSYNDYKFEFTDQDHEELAEYLKNIKGLAMISGYDCSLMNSLYKNFNKIKLPAKKNHRKNTFVQETIWMNYEPVQYQKTLFNEAQGRVTI